MTGPPTLPPTTFWSYRGIWSRSVIPWRASAAPIALSLRFSSVQYADPWIALVPLRSAMLNCPPVECPNSAVNWFCNIENSATASLGTRMFAPVTSARLLSTPSTMKLFCRGRCPPTEGPSPSPMPPLLPTPAPSSDRLYTPSPRLETGLNSACCVVYELPMVALVVSISVEASVTSIWVATVPTASDTLAVVARFNTTSTFCKDTAVKPAARTAML